MCDQTEVVYSPGDVVWVKLGPVWWPGQVFDYDKLPEEITANLRKRPIAVVKFFQEDSYEYVKNLNAIYHYNCRRKHEFIKKGLDMCRSNSRDIPSNMKMFPNDIVTAEHLTNGDPNILNSKEFAPEEKEDYSELFGKKTPKKGKTESSFKSGRRSLPTPMIPRPITHPRFITKALEGRSDHEVRIRQQILPSGSRSPSTPMKQYNCHLCGFASSRINVIVLHNKSHSAGYADAYLPPQQHSGKGRKIKSERKMVYTSEKRPRVSDVFKSDEPPTKRKNVKVCEVNSQSQNITLSDKSKPSVDTSSKGTSSRKPVFGRKKSAKDKAEKLAKEKQQNDAFRETLLKDWDEDEDTVDTSKEDDFSKEKDNSMDSLLISSDKKENKSFKRKETSCFDFDDSEDGLNIGETVMKFGQKIPRVFGDKPKKQNKSLCEENLLNVDSSGGNKLEAGGDKLSSKSGPSDQIIIPETTEKRDTEEDNKEKETEDMHSAFESLLGETVVPVIPDAPSHFEIIKKHIDLETSVKHEEHSNLVDDDSIEDHVDDVSERVEDSADVTEVQKVTEEINEVHSEQAVSDSDRSNVKIEEQNISDVGENKAISCLSTEHFLVKTSEEVATSSSDSVQLEESISPIENNVAETKNECKISNSVADGECSSETTKICSDENNSTVNEEPVKFEISENVPKTEFSVSYDFPRNVKDSSEIVLPSDPVNLAGDVKVEENKVSFGEASITLHEDMETDAVLTSNVEQNKSSSESGNHNFQEMDFDINSMPVIISEDMGQSQGDIIVSSVNKSNSFPTSKVVTTVKSDINTSSDSKMITVKNITKAASVDCATTSNLSAVLKEDVGSMSLKSSHGKDNKTSTRKVLLSPTKTVQPARSPQVATIKVQPAASVATKLTMPGGIISQKNVGGTGQVLILKSATPGQPGKSTLQKIGNTSQMIQQGGKVLILTNPQGAAGQSKVLTSLTTQQKNLSSSKLTGTRILTTKGTVLTTGSQGAISKANILSGSSKTVTTKSGQKILINKGGVISQTPKSVIINKSGVLTAVNSPAIVSSKSSLAATSQINSSQITVSSKGATATILTSPGFTTSGKSMILATPVTTNKGGVSLTNNQKLRLITTSKACPVSAATGSGTKLMIQSTPSRMILPSSSIGKNQQLKLVGNLKGQSSTSTILIQTSQGVIATTPLTSSQVGNKSKITKSSLPTVISTALTPNKATTLQVAHAVSQSQNKLIVQKVKSAGPNILQKTQKKPIQRSNKRTVTNQLLATPVSAAQSVQTARTPVSVSPLSSAAQDTLILSSGTGLPVMGQSNVQGSQLDTSNQTALVYLTVDESGKLRPIESTPVVNYEGASADSQTLYIDPGTADLDNIFLAIDDAGNVVNIAPPVQNTYTTESSTPPSQDILAKALANTQVLQQETVATENVPLTSCVESSMLSGCMFVEPQTQYPQPSLSHSVLETSLTLNQPIMTPLEVPSAVSPRSLDQISSMQTGFLNDSTLLQTNVCTSKDKKSSIHPSMPLLTEETDCTTPGNVDNKSETVFFTQVGVDGSHAVLTPVTSGSQLAFQLSLDENNVIVSSTPSMTSVGVISGSSLPQGSLTYIPQPALSTVSDINDKKPIVNVNNSTATMPTVFSSVPQKTNIIEKYQVTDNEQVIISDSNIDIKSSSNDDMVLGLSDSSVPTSVSFEIKGVESCIVDENNAVEDVKSVNKADDETTVTSVGEDINDDTLICTRELTETKTADNYLKIPVDEIVVNDERSSILNSTADSSSTGYEQAVSKTDTVVATKEETFFAVTDVLSTKATVMNGNGDIVQTGKRHLEEVVSSPSDNSLEVETKKVKLDER